MKLIYLMWQGSYQARNEENKNNPRVLKIIQYYFKLKNKAEDLKKRKGGNMNVTRNTAKMNARIT